MVKTCLECLPCLGKNAVDMAKRSTSDPELRKKITQEAFQFLAQISFHDSPPCYARKILDLNTALAGEQDLFPEEKRKSNHLARELLKELPRLPGYDPAEFESRMRLAVAGNILDFGVYCDLDIGKALEVVKLAFVKSVDREAVQKLRDRMESARKILYLLDNCGEAVFDRVFLEPYREKTILVVRGRNVFNDVAMEDLEDCGLAGFTRGTVANGSTGIPGTVLEYADETFCREFYSADLIIAKGQGNFETLSDTTAPTAFLFMAKCPVVAREIGAELQSLQVRIVNF